jgi:hypothetical protein
MRIRSLAGVLLMACLLLPPGAALAGPHGDAAKAAWARGGDAETKAKALANSLGSGGGGGEASVVLTQPGTGTSITTGKAPEPARPLSAEEKARLGKALVNKNAKPPKGVTP